MSHSLLSARTTTKLVLCFAFSACQGRDGRVPELPAARMPPLVGGAHAFFGAREEGEWRDPHLPMSTPAWRAQAGDRLVYALDDDAVRAARSGVELSWSDGGTTQAVPRDAVEGERMVEVPLDEHAGRELVAARFVARSHEVGASFARFAAVELRSADGRREALAPAVAGLHALQRHDEGGAAHVALPDGVVAESAPLSLPTGAVVGDPWLPIDFGPRRSRGLESDPLCVLGDGVLMRLAPPDRAVSAAGESLMFAPLDGGKSYDAWLCVEAPAAPFECELVVLGTQGERRPARLRLDRAAGGVLPLGDGRWLVHRALAADFGVRGLELPRDGRLRLHGATLRLVRAGGSDRRFVRAFLAAERRDAAWLSDPARAALERWEALHATGSTFFEFAGEDEALRDVHEAFLRRDPPLVEALASRRVEELLARRGELSGLSVAFVAVPATGAALEAAMRSASAAGLPLLGAGSADLSKVPDSARAVAEELAARGLLLPDALRPSSGAGPTHWTAGMAVRGVELAARSLPPGVARLAVFDGDPQVSRVLASACESAGVEQLVARGPARGRPGGNERWNAADGSGVWMATPHADLGGAPTLDESWWRAFVAARAGVESVALVVVELGLDGDAAMLEALQRWRACELAPSIVGSAPGELEAAFKRLDESAWNERATLALDRAAEAGLVAARRADTALARHELLAGLAAQHGADLGVAPSRAAWGERFDAGADALALARSAGRAAAGEREVLLAHGAAIDTSGAGVPVVAWNTLPFERVAWLELSDSLDVVDHAGSTLPTQRTGNGGTLARVPLPALGHAVVRVSPRRSPRDAGDPTAGSAFENELVSFRMTPSRAGGVVSLESFVHKKSGRELLAAPLRLCERGAWRVLESGPLRTVLEGTLGEGPAPGRVTISLFAGESSLRLEHAGAEPLRLEVAVPPSFRAWMRGLVLDAGQLPPRDAQGTRFDDWLAFGDGLVGLALVSADCARADLATGVVAEARHGREAHAAAVELPAGRARLSLCAFEDGARRGQLIQLAALQLAGAPMLAVSDKAGGVPAWQAAVALSRDSDGTRGAQCGLLAPFVRASIDGPGLELALLETRGSGSLVRLRPLLPHRELERVDAGGLALEPLQLEDGAAPLSMGPGRLDQARIRR